MGMVSGGGRDELELQHTDRQTDRQTDRRAWFYSIFCDDQLVLIYQKMQNLIFM